MNILTDHIEGAWFFHDDPSGGEDTPFKAEDGDMFTVTKLFDVQIPVFRQKLLGNEQQQFIDNVDVIGALVIYRYRDGELPRPYFFFYTEGCAPTSIEFEGGYFYVTVIEVSSEAQTGSPLLLSKTEKFDSLANTQFLDLYHNIRNSGPVIWSCLRLP